MEGTTGSAPLPAFRFHPDAYATVFEDRTGTCDACGHLRELRYTSSFYSVHRPGHLCPWCIADGTAARVFDGEFSDRAGVEGAADDPDVAGSHDTHGTRVPTDAREVLEVTTRTPSYVSWQQERWPSHCGRPCAFIADVGADGLAPFLHEPDFAADVDAGAGYGGELVRQWLTAGGDLAGYLFECLTCGAHRLHVDAG